MEKKLKISVITVTKNSEKFLNENFKSLENQTYKNFEHIIIDGNSKDKTLKIIKENSKTYIIGLVKMILAFMTL